MERREYPDDVVRLIILTNTSILFEEDHSYVNLFHGLEIVIIILTLLSSLVTIYFGCTTRAAHFNLLNILILYEVLYFPFAIARIVLILIERRVFQFNGVFNHDLPYLICGLIQGWFLMTHAVKIPAMLGERLFASYFIGDYERERRTWITVVLSIFILSSSFIMTFLTHVNIGSWFLCVFPAFFLQVGSLLVFAYIHCKNKRINKELDSKVDYTLSRKFQVAENWRVLKLIKTKIITTVLIVLICCFMMSAVMSMEEDSTRQAKVTMILELCFSGFPLLINITVIYSFDAWRGKFIRNRRDNSAIDMQDHRQMADIHFAQIESAWR